MRNVLTTRAVTTCTSGMQSSNCTVEGLAWKTWEQKELFVGSMQLWELNDGTSDSSFDE